MQRGIFPAIGSCMLLVLLPPPSGAQTTPPTTTLSPPATGPADSEIVGSRGGLTRTQLAGNSLARYPFFEFVRAFNEGATIEIAVDTAGLPGLVGATTDVYVTKARTASQWQANPALTDITAAPEVFTFGGGSIQTNTLTVDTGTLSGTGPAPWTDIGVGFDVVIDVDRDGLLGSGDVIDGLGDEAGGYVVHDITQPGPFTVTEILYTGGTWLGQDTYYPANIASMGKLPLVVISHGNGHDYRWYDHIGNHLASYGYLVMAHQNNTGPGIQTASTTTLTNTDYIINNQGTINGGVLNGHIDTHNICWIGHSRGAEGITRAYDKIFDGTFVPTSGYTLADLKLLTSMAPTDFLGFSSSTPHAANFHLWTGSADSDVNGCANCDLCQTFQIHERATQFRQSTVLQGVGHSWFHDNGGNPWASGPCLIGEAETHLIQLPHLLALMEYYVEGSLAAKDFLWRQYESFHPIGAPVADPCVVVTHMYREGPSGGKFVIDDFQSNSSTLLSSSGGAVSFTVTSLTEGDADDPDNAFTHSAGQAMNGMTLNGAGADDSRIIVFEWGTTASITFDVVPAGRDMTGYSHLSFRAAQAPRHPLTTVSLGDLVFTVGLQDSSGNQSSIDIGAYGGGIEEPYQRTGCGSGVGWAGEFETIRIRLTDFTHNSSLDLSNVTHVFFRFGGLFGSPQGRLGLDEIELTVD